MWSVDTKEKKKKKEEKKENGAQINACHSMRGKIVWKCPLYPFMRERYFVLSHLTSATN